MSKDYIATFYTHYGAMKFLSTIKAKGLPGRMGPVPRSLSSSCGVCVFFKGELDETLKDSVDLEQIVKWEEKW